MAKSSACSICPFTLKSLASTKRDDVAVIYRTNPLLTSTLAPSAVSDDDGGAEAAGNPPCGHSCTLSHLVPYLHDSGGGSKSCPVCHKSPASVVCDSYASAFLATKRHRPNQGGGIGESGNGDGRGRIVSFRYGTTFYFLWVHSSPPPSSYSKLFSHRNDNALDRIGSVMSMDVKNGLKVRDNCHPRDILTGVNHEAASPLQVIYRGKVIYPDNGGENVSSDDISDQLLDISSADLIHCLKKPSLVVMGLRQQSSALRKSYARNVLFNVVTRLTPRYIWKLITYAFRWTIHTTKSLARGVCLFVTSILYLPRANQ